MFNSKQHNRDQLKQCIYDLAERSKELDEPAIACVLFTIAASITEHSDYALSAWVSEFAKVRVGIIKEKLKEFEQ
jgi:hypothetical protein